MRSVSQRISIIVTTRNEGENVARTIRSLFQSTSFPDFEVLVMDDASDDGSTDFLKAPPYCNDLRVRYIRTESQKGYLALRREAVRLASGSVLQFLDAHHAFTPGWLTNLYQNLERRDFRAVVGPVVGVLDPAAWDITRTASFGWCVDATCGKVWAHGPERVGPDGRVIMLAGHQLMIARSLYEEIGGWCPLFQGHGTEDVDFCLRAFLLGYDCHIEPTAIIGHLWKNQFMNPVTWGQVMLNYLLVVHLNLGGDKLEELKTAWTEHHGYSEGLETFERMRSEVDSLRAQILKNQRRSTHDLLQHLVPAESNK